MRKSLKMKTLATLSVFALGAGALGVSLGVNAQTASAEEPAFYVLNGASVRLTETPAVRFTLLMSKELYNSGLTSENVEVGAVLMPQDMLTDTNGDGIDEADLNVNTQGAVVAKMAGTNDENVRFSAWVESTEVNGYMQSYVMLEGIPEESFNRPISVIGYATVDGQNYSYTENVVTRSLAGVAYELVAKELLPETEVSQYLTQTFAVSFFDEDGETEMANVQSLKYGETLTVPAAEKDGKIFQGWQKRIGTANGEAVWSETFYDFTAENATFVQGNLQFRAVWVDAPTAFGSVLTTNMFKQTQEYQGETYEYASKIDYVQKDGKKVAVLKTAKAGLPFSATAEFNALIPATAKDTDNIVFDLYAYAASGWVLAGKTQNTNLAANTWHTATTTVGAWKANSGIYSNNEIAVANFRIEAVPLINAFGTQIISAADYLPNTTLAAIEKDGETIGAFNASAWTSGVVCTATDAFLALFADAKDIDTFLMDVYFETSWYFYRYGLQQKDIVYQANTWYTIEISVGQFRSAPKFQTLAKVYIANIRLVKALAVSAFGTDIVSTANYLPNTTLAGIEKDGETIGAFNASAWTSGATCTATDAFLALFADAKDNDSFLMDVYFETSWYFYRYGLQQKDIVYQANTWYTIEISVGQFRSAPKFQTLAKVYIANIRLVKAPELMGFGSAMDTSKTYFTNNGAAATFDTLEKDGKMVVVLKNKAGYPMVASEEFNALLPQTANDNDYVVVDVYFYEMHWFTIGGVSYKSGTEQYGCYKAGTWQTFKCTVAQWKAKSTFYSDANVGICNFRIQSAS